MNADRHVNSLPLQVEGSISRGMMRVGGVFVGAMLGLAAGALCMMCMLRMFGMCAACVQRAGIGRRRTLC